MPACRIWPTHDRLSAVSSPNHGMSVSIRDMAAVLRAPVERRSASAARSRELPSPGGGGYGADAHGSTLVTGAPEVSRDRDQVPSESPVNTGFPAYVRAGTSG